MKTFFLLIVLLLIQNGYSQNNNDLILKALLNDSTFLKELHIVDCDTLIVRDKLDYFDINELRNNENKLFIISKTFTEEDSYEGKYLKSTYRNYSKEAISKLIGCSNMFVEKIEQKKKIIYFHFTFPQKSRSGYIKFKIKNSGRIVILRRVMGFW